MSSEEVVTQGNKPRFSRGKVGEVTKEVKLSSTAINKAPIVIGVKYQGQAQEGNPISHSQ
jgi:hypothetical protein